MLAAGLPGSCSIDLHVHSHLTKGCDLDPRAVLERAASLGLDGVAFTETNTQDGCDELFDLQPRTPLRIFVGLELVTDRGQYLCFFPRPEEAPEPVQLWGSNREKPWSAAECLPKVKSLGAAVVAARPYDRDFPTPALDQVLTLTGLSADRGLQRPRPPAGERPGGGGGREAGAAQRGRERRASSPWTRWAAGRPSSATG